MAVLLHFFQLSPLATRTRDAREKRESNTSDRGSYSPHGLIPHYSLLSLSLSLAFAQPHDGGRRQCGSIRGSAPKSAQEQPAASTVTLVSV